MAFSPSTPQSLIIQLLSPMQLHLFLRNECIFKQSAPRSSNCHFVTLIILLTTHNLRWESINYNKTVHSRASGGDRIMTVLSYGEATNACVTGIHGNARTRKFVIFPLIRGQPHYHFFTISSFLFAQFIFQRPNSMLPFAGTVPNNYYLGKFNGKLN